MFQDVLKYEMESADIEDKMYFYVDSTSGVISLKKVLVDSNIDRFTVSKNN